MTMQPFNAQFPFMEFLEEDPGTRAGYFSFQDRFGQSPTQRNWFENQFSNIRNEFLGTLGQQIRQGQTPNAQFTDFLQAFPFSQRFSALPPSMRGAATSRFAPQTRFFF